MVIATRSLMLSLILAAPGFARADVTSPVDPDDPCTIELQCPGEGDERFDNPGVGDHVEAELRERGLERRCERQMTSGRAGTVSTMIVYCPVRAEGCGCTAPGSSAGASVAGLVLVLGLLIRRRRR